MTTEQLDVSQLHHLHETYPAGHVLFREGDTGKEMFIVLEGEILISKSQHVLDRLKKGAIFGEMALVDSFPRSADATVYKDCKIVKILNLID